MNRILLALMALLAGFAAQVAPAAARVNANTQIGAAANAGTLERHAAVLAATTAPHPVRPFVLETQVIPPARGAFAPMLPAVLIGIDRAHE